jgi:hypothetical protein
MAAFSRKPLRGNLRLARWDERRCQLQFGLDVWGFWRLNFLATDETQIFEVIL